VCLPSHSASQDMVFDASIKIASIFQKKTVLDIVKEIFRKTSLLPMLILLNVNAPIAPWNPACILSRNRFNFVSRLLEQEGIYYYFVTKKINIHLLLANSYTFSSPYFRVTRRKFPVNPVQIQLWSVQKNQISSWHLSKQIQTVVLMLLNAE